MIHKEMKIEDVLRSYPQTVAVFRRFGIDCATSPKLYPAAR